MSNPDRPIVSVEGEDRIRAYNSLCRYCFTDSIGWTSHIHPLPGIGSYTLGIFDDRGRCESGITDIRFDTRYFGRDWPSCGISAVASDPAVRNSGQIRRLIQAILRRDRDGGVAMSYLYPFSYRFYGKFGYGTLGPYRSYTISPEDIRPIDSDLRMEAFDWSEAGFAELSELHNRWILRWDGAVRWPYRSYSAAKESAERFRHYYYVLRNNAGELAAWLRFSQDDDWEKPAMFVHKMIWADADGLAGLFAFFARHRSQIREIHLPLPHAVPVDHFCREQRPEARLSHEWMARPLDVSALLQAAVAQADFSGDFALSLHDPALAENSGRYEVSQGSVNFTADSVAPEAADLPFGIFSSLLLGGIGLESARLAGLVRGDVMAGCETLFDGRRDIFISDRF
jgi:predicted acetyltransferase